MKRLANDLKHFKNKSLTLKEIKSKNINVSKLRNLGLVCKKTVESSKIVVPEGAPRWAIKYKFTRKKYGIYKDLKLNEEYCITNKGLRQLNRDKRKENKDEDENIKDEVGKK